MYENPHPWNEKANLLYIESPSGVGYSIAGSDEDWVHTDMSTSRDAFAAVELFFKKFPDYLENELYISGESYAGLYVPYLAW
jgi:carboxypeptidase C (cathepsin A)